MSTPLVSVRDLVRHYRLANGTVVRAVDGVTFGVAAGETLALVGESGSGKSTVGRAVLGLEPPDAGCVTFDGVDLASTGARDLRALRRRMQMVFQDPTGSLNPRRTVGASIAEGLAIHRLVPHTERAERVAALLGEVGLDPADAGRYPHQCSGGQRQRVGVARALAVDPMFIVCDEPVSALDVSIQAQVLNLLVDLRDRRGLAYLLIAHDLAVVRQVAHRVAVMYLGTIVEIGAVRDVIDTPRHPYTRALVSAAPHPDPDRRGERIVLGGEPPASGDPLPGCPFASRCFHPRKDARCLAERPALLELADRRVACHHEREP